MQKSQQLARVEAELAKLSLDSESRVLSEMERISTEHHQQTASHCDELCRTLQQDVARVSELIERCRQDSVTEMKSGSEQLLREILASIEIMSVLCLLCCVMPLRSRPELCPRPHWGSLKPSTRPPIWFKGDPTSKGRGR